MEDGKQKLLLVAIALELIQDLDNAPRDLLIIATAQRREPQQQREESRVEMQLRGRWGGRRGGRRGGKCW